MGTLSIPQSFPVGLTTGGLNGQPTKASVIEECYRGLLHLTGARKPNIPLFCGVRVFTHVDNPSFTILIRREFYSKAGTLYLFYSTLNNTDIWRLEVTDYVGTKITTLGSSVTNTAMDSLEGSVAIDIGPGLVDDHTLNSGDLSLTIFFSLASRDPAYADTQENIQIYSAIIEVDPMFTVEQ